MWREGEIVGHVSCCSIGVARLIRRHDRCKLAAGWRAARAAVEESKEKVRLFAAFVRSRFRFLVISPVAWLSTTKKSRRSGSSTGFDHDLLTMVDFLGAKVFSSALWPLSHLGSLGWESQKWTSRQYPAVYTSR